MHSFFRFLISQFQSWIRPLYRHHSQFSMTSISQSRGIGLFSRTVSGRNQSDIIAQIIQGAETIDIRQFYQKKNGGKTAKSRYT